MSLQAFPDIIVNPLQIQDTQLSKTIQNSPNTTSTVSFADILSSTQNEIYSPKNDGCQSSSVQNDSGCQSSSVNDDGCQSSAVKKDDGCQSSNVQKDDGCQSSSVSEDSKTNSKEVEKSNVQEKSEKKTLGKDESNESKDKIAENSKKLKSKDFARLNELTKKEENKEETAVDSVKIAEVSEKFQITPQMQNKESEKSTENENKTELSILETIGGTENQLQVAQQQQLENESTDFNFSGENSDNRKQFLDKEQKITVQDLRTEPSKEINLEKNDLKVSEVKQTGENTAQITIDLAQNVNSDVLTLNSQSANADGSSFQAMLNNQIQTNASEFVKAGNIVLKDNNQGTIDLVLHPDDMGNVKIHLSLDGKTISGQITVNTKEALQVFKDNAETLREAFIKNGFDGASFDVAFNNGGASSQDFAFNQRDDGTSLLAKKVYGNSAEGINSEGVNSFMNDENYSNYSVNIVA